MADRVYSHLLQGDSGGLFELIAESDREVMDLTPENFDKLVHWLHQELRGFKPDGARIDTTAAAEGLLTKQQLRHPDGRETRLEIPFFNTEDGPKMYVASIFWAALPMRTLNKYRSLYRPLAYAKANLDALNEQMPVIKEFAPGMPSTQGLAASRLNSWSALRLLMEDSVRSFEREAERAKNSRALDGTEFP